jgi:hypothetical protein
VKRGVVLAVPVLLSAVLLAGCGKPAGVDGNLTNGWAQLPEAKIAVPDAGTCYDSPQDDLSEVTKWPEPVDCGTSHNVELAYVGQFSGSDADGASPPAVGSAGRRKAYESCADQVKTYLGDDWRKGFLELVVNVPIAQHWDAGARYYRCDLQVYKDLIDYDVADRTGSLRGTLKDPTSTVLQTCFRVTTKSDGSVDKMTPTPCTSSHNGEFAGVYEYTDQPYPTDDNTRRAGNLAGCRGVVTGFAGVPNDDNFLHRAGQIATPFGKAAWERGNRGVLCYLWPDQDFSKSLKGAGPTVLPIN